VPALSGRRQLGWARILVGACAVGGLVLSACGGSSGSSSASTGGSAATGHSAHYAATSGDQQICSTVKQAEIDYRSKNYEAWRNDMANNSSSANQANYPQLKTYAHAARFATEPASKQPRYGFGAAGAYVGLMKACKSIGLQ